uniref:Beta-1,4-endoglucanase 2 n=1 Tax=Heterodera avenae TaxID=34510 RepID=T1PRW3_HETAV|nr:beta-1,4-endoglucanase 2 [Heterodera avenae]AFQ55681.1 beta-1,4-endoglucanase 2 [Heterodera avenae]
MLVKQLFLLQALGIFAFVNSLNPKPPPFGQLSVSGTKLVSANGQPVQLIGNSLSWHTLWPQYWDAGTVKGIKCGWNANVIRAAMGVESVDAGNGVMKGGYLSDPNNAYRMITTVIEAAISEGLYVIVDWHAHEPHANEAAAFFTRIAKSYGQYPHILYETYNEPLKISWNNVLVPYHKQVVGAIRAVDQKNVIILGTPFWSQNVDEAAQNPIQGFKNLMYTLHYYASSHFVHDIGNKLRTANSKGLPVFVTEYGVCEASGDGRIDQNSANQWWGLLDYFKISYVNWSIAGPPQSCSALQPGTSPWSVGDPSKWTAAAHFVANYHKNKPTGVRC